MVLVSISDGWFNREEFSFKIEKEYSLRISKERTPSGSRSCLLLELESPSTEEIFLYL